MTVRVPLQPCTRRRSRRVLRLLALLLWAGALAYLSLAPEVKAPPGPLGWDKLSHFSAYAVLTLLLIRTVSAWQQPSLRLLAVSWLSCFTYGLLLESLQWLMAAGRQWEFGDLCANALGALAVCVLLSHSVVRFFKHA